MPIISNPLDLLFQNVFFETNGSIKIKYLDSIFSSEWVKASCGLATATFSDGASVVPCEPLSDVIARHRPASAVAPEPQKSNGHDGRLSAGSDSRVR